MNTAASRQIESPPNWIFPAFGSVLDPSSIQKNPSRPERPETIETVEQTTVSSVSFSVALRFQREGDHEWHWCPAFFVGDAVDPPAQVCLRPVRIFLAAQKKKKMVWSRRPILSHFSPFKFRPCIEICLGMLNLLVSPSF
jgi:hypothetical protein